MEETGQKIIAKNKSGPIWAGISLLGGLIGAGSVYLCYYNVAGPNPGSNGLSIVSGTGLIISFCLLTASLIMGIKILINSPRRRFWSILAIAISGTGVMGLIVISFLGTMI